MVKRYGDIYPKIYDIDNLRLAHRMAREDKSFYKEVQVVDDNEDYYLKQIQYMLKNKTYSLKSDDYTVFKKNDRGKIREIHKLDYFPHRIIQWALILQIQYILLPTFIDNSFSLIRNIKRGMRRIKAELENGGKLTYSEWCNINSYKGWLKWCNGYNLYKKYIKPLEPYCEKYYLTNIKKVI